MPESSNLSSLAAEPVRSEQTFEAKLSTKNSKKTQANFLGLSPYWWLAIIAVSYVLLILLIYFFRFGGPISPNISDWKSFGDFVSGLLNPVLGLIGLVAVIWTLKVNGEALNYSAEALKNSAEERVDRTLDLFRAFRYDYMKESRKIAWAARGKWYADKSYRDKMTAHFYIEDDSVGLTEIERKELSAIYDMVEFYGMLGIHQGNDDAIRAFSFYYSFWRGFLHEVREAHKNAYHNMNLTKNEMVQFPEYYWVKNLDKLDDKLGLPTYNQVHHPHDKKYLAACAPSKGRDLHNADTELP